MRGRRPWQLQFLVHAWPSHPGPSLSATNVATHRTGHRGWHNQPWPAQHRTPWVTKPAQHRTPWVTHPALASPAQDTVSNKPGPAQDTAGGTPGPAQPSPGHRGWHMRPCPTRHSTPWVTSPAPHRTPWVAHPALPSPGAAGPRPPRPGPSPAPPWSSSAPWRPAAAALPGAGPHRRRCRPAGAFGLGGVYFCPKTSLGRGAAAHPLSCGERSLAHGRGQRERRQVQPRAAQRPGRTPGTCPNSFQTPRWLSLTQRLRPSRRPFPPCLFQEHTNP